MGSLNVANGNLRQQIPLASFPQRGSRPLVSALAYDSRIWQVVGTSWQPTNVLGPWHGWRVVTSVSPGTASNSASTLMCLIGGIIGGHWYPEATVRNGFTWTDPIGTVHVFSVGTIQPISGTPCSSPPNVPNSAGYANDSTGLYMSVTNYTNVVVYAADGTQLYPTVEDTNGNYFSTDSNGY